MTSQTYAQTEMFKFVQVGETLLLPVAPLTELEQMAADLDAMQAEDDLWTAPFARLTDEQLEELENERPGEEICLNPWNW